MYNDELFIIRDYITSLESHLDYKHVPDEIYHGRLKMLGLIERVIKNHDTSCCTINWKSHCFDLENANRQLSKQLCDHVEFIYELTSKKPARTIEIHNPPSEKDLSLSHSLGFNAGVIATEYRLNDKIAYLNSEIVRYRTALNQIAWPSASPQKQKDYKTPLEIAAYTLRIDGMPLPNKCPICGGKEHADPLPGTNGKRCVKCCNVETSSHLQDPWGNLIKVQGEPIPMKAMQVPSDEAFDLENPLDYVTLRDFYIAHNGMKE